MAAAPNTKLIETNESGTASAAAFSSPLSTKPDVQFNCVPQHEWSPDAIKKLELLVYIRFTVADIHGIGRTRAVLGPHLAEYVGRGIDVRPGLLTAGLRCDRSEVTREVKVKDVQNKVEADVNLGNILLVPIPETLRTLYWLYVHPTEISARQQVGEVLCESFWTKEFRLGPGVHQETCTRYLARKQLKNIANNGYFVMSSFDVVFTLYNHKNSNDQDGNTSSAVELSNHWRLLPDISQHLLAIEIDVLTIRTESAVGQFGLTIRKKHGIGPSDDMFRAKQYIKELSERHGYKASFMTKPCETEQGNYLALKHSLWAMNLVRNIFYDSKAADGLSDVARSWIAGLMKHARGLTALCCLTVNCYRRVRDALSPSNGCWGIDDWNVTFCVKNCNSRTVYVDNCLPGGSANPYIVTAATIAAGMDGIMNRYSIPSQKERIKLPRSLSEALDALHKDQMFADTLGAEFIGTFISCKQEFEVDKLTHDSLIEELNLYHQWV